MGTEAVDYEEKAYIEDVCKFHWNICINYYGIKVKDEKYE